MTTDNTPAGDASTGERLSADERDALEAAIAANPEAVAAFVERLGAVNELLDVVSLGTAALDDEMVRSLADTGAALGEVADTAADDEVRDGVITLLRGVGTAEQQTPSDVGALGLARSLRDPAVQRGLSYLLTLSKAIGREQREQREREGEHKHEHEHNHTPTDHNHR